LIVGFAVCLENLFLKFMSFRKFRAKLAFLENQFFRLFQV